VAGTIITDRIESDASYASSITVASPLVVSNTFAIPSGSASAPAISPTGDTNTGIFFPAADTIAFSEGGVESMRIDSSGNLGIGTSTVRGSSILNLSQPAAAGGGISIETTGYTDNNFKQIGFYNGSSLISYIRELQFTVGASGLSFGTYPAGGPATERMRIDSSGRVTMPYQPIFHIRKSDGSQTHADVISFNDALTNIGSHYSTITNRFTAPVAGTYHFYSSVLDDGAIAGHAGVRFGLRKNGTFIQKNQNFYNRTDSTYNFTYVAMTITLAVNDYIDVCNDGGSASIYGADSGVFGCFGGYLIG
jgi:hypothetical protein